MAEYPVISNIKFQDCTIDAALGRAEVKNRRPRLLDAGDQPPGKLRGDTGRNRTLHHGQHCPLPTSPQIAKLLRLRVYVMVLVRICYRDRGGFILFLFYNRTRLFNINVQGIFNNISAVMDYVFTLHLTAFI